MRDADAIRADIAYAIGNDLDVIDYLAECSRARRGVDTTESVDISRAPHERSDERDSTHGHCPPRPATAN